MTALAYAAALESPGIAMGWAVRSRAARVADAPTIHRLVAAWSGQGLTIPRSLGNVLGSLGDFTVTEVLEPTPRVIACGALEFITDGLAEIRSVAVDPEAPRMGAGSLVVEQLLIEAEARRLREVILLTKAPAFFARCGFTEVAHADLPAVFTAQHLPAQGRTLIGRTAMRRVLPDAALVVTR